MERKSNVMLKMKKDCTAERDGSKESRQSLTELNDPVFIPRPLFERNTKHGNDPDCHNLTFTHKQHESDDEGGEIFLNLRNMICKLVSISCLLENFKGAKDEGRRDYYPAFKMLHLLGT